ncbi:MAG TPA: siphovirus Gp157 family protein, partial [Candidatus Cloacimonadota bacterium]|nr:siphovirus Gp157 family protein [Candidatus Cloacimonadota bacterium]
REWQVLQDMLEESQGELTPEVEAYMDTIQGKSITALFNLQDVREVCQMGKKAIKDKIAELNDKIKKLDRADDNLKSIQVALMQNANQKSMANGQYKITLTQNPLRVEVVDETAIPSTYMKATVEMTAAEYELIKSQIEAKSVKFSADKKAIGDLYKTAEVGISGCEYIREPNVRVS